MNHILEVDGIRVSFKNKTVLKDIYLKVETGEIVGVLGRNGSGKSTLFDVIFGNLSTNEKSIRINQTPFKNNNRTPELIRYLPQYNFVPNNLSIDEAFDFFKLSFDEFIQVFEIFKHDRKTKIKHLSSGEKRIIETYLILKSKTKFCMLDEPFSQLSPKSIETFTQFIQKEKEYKGILITDHLYQNIIELCDSIYFLQNGSLLPISNHEQLETLGYFRF